MAGANTKKISLEEEFDKEESKIPYSNYDQKALVMDTGPMLGYRHLQMVLLSICLIFGVGSRANLSVAIVAMTDNTTSPNPSIPSYDWDHTSVILSSFFWSYISLQLVAGYLGKTYGPKYFLFVAFFVNCSACALTPLAAEKLGSTGVMVCRIIQGLGQGFMFPSVNVLFGKWVPEQERATLCNIALAGAQIGSIFALIMTGYVSASWWGWPASYYILSSMGIAWCFIWLFLGSSSPASHPWISESEKHYIQSSLKQGGDNVDLPVPWMKIFTSVPFYALMAAQFGNVWGYAILMTETPTYLSKAMDFDVKSNSLISATPYLVSLICMLIMARLSDWIISRNILSKHATRKSFQVIGSYGQASCLIWLSFLQKSQANWSIFVLALGNALTSCISVGSAVNYADLSPRLSGVLYGIINTTGQIASLVGPLSTNWIVTDSTNVAQWQFVFVIAAGFFIAGGTVFLFFSSADRQSWDGPENPQKEEKIRKSSVVSLEPGLV